MRKCILHLGSNIGFKFINLELAEVMISNHIGDIIAISHHYETEPWGNTDQDSFINKAIIVRCDLRAKDIMEQVTIIENKMGRERTIKWGPRIIDIDILFYGEKIIENPDLKIPHPEVSNRNFVLTPLMDICPDLIHPILNKSIRELHAECPDKSKVEKINDEPSA